jgi:hypothetical protein
MSNHPIAFLINPSLGSRLTVINAQGSLWAVTGRLPYKDNDHTRFIVCDTLDEAMEAFTAQVYAESGKQRPVPGDEYFDEDEVIVITDTHEIGVRRTSVSYNETQVQAEIREPALDIPGIPAALSAQLVFGRPDQVIEVMDSLGAPAQWAISPYLALRNGHINTYDEATKPLAELVCDQSLLPTLMEQTSERGYSSVARKDGVFGILFEAEGYCSLPDSAECFINEYPLREEVLARLLCIIQENQARFPSVHFCIPQPSEDMHETRPTLWAFVPNGVLHEDARAELDELIHQTILQISAK